MKTSVLTIAVRLGADDEFRELWNQANAVKKMTQGQVFDRMLELLREDLARKVPEIILK